MNYCRVKYKNTMKPLKMRKIDTYWSRNMSMTLKKVILFVHTQTSHTHTHIMILFYINVSA